MRIGVLSLQGDFARHMQTLLTTGTEPVAVRHPEDLANVDAAIIPGGESTTIGTLCERYGLLDAFREHIGAGMPVLGTCAGAILLAEEIVGSDQPRIGLLDIAIRRNAYGRQRESFEADVSLLPQLSPAAETVTTSGERRVQLPSAPFRGVFIRAPYIERFSDNIEILGRLESTPVLVRSGNIWAATFHPELTPDTRIHAAFVDHVLTSCASS